MTKDEAIEFIKKCSEEKAHGYMVIAINDEDINNVDEDAFEKLNFLPNKEKALSVFADELNERYEEEYFGEELKRICAICFE